MTIQINISQAEIFIILKNFFKNVMLQVTYIVVVAQDPYEKFLCKHEGIPTLAAS